MSDTTKYDIFLSYEAAIRESILKLYEIITRVHGLKVWLDYYCLTAENSGNSGRHSNFEFKKTIF